MTKETITIPLRHYEDLVACTESFLFAQQTPKLDADQAEELNGLLDEAKAIQSNRKKARRETHALLVSGYIGKNDTLEDVVAPGNARRIAQSITAHPWGPVPITQAQVIAAAESAIFFLKNRRMP